jgi:preflagellin peptidase FlaK
MVNTLEVRIYLTLLFFLYASYLDLKYREIDPRLWQSMIGLGFLIILADIVDLNNPRLLIVFLIILLLATIFAISIHYLGLMGGGDVKLIIALGAMFPYLPSGSFILPTLFLSAFTNAIVIALTIPLFFFIYNLKHLPSTRSPKDFLRLFVAYKKDAKNLDHFEAVLNEGQLFINTKNMELGKTNKMGSVWVTPAFPFVVFLTAGFTISVFYGDILSIIF